MQPADGPARVLARRLRALREEHWADLNITQGQLAAALTTGRPLSVPLISSWESQRNPKVPPVNRLAAYATFFATERSVAQHPFRLLDLAQLTEDEHGRRDELLAELKALRAEALTDQVSTYVSRDLPVAGELTGGSWHFPDMQPITLVCAQLPAELRDRMPYTDPANPDYVELYTYADLDALMELHGHIRAVNPTSQVNFRTAAALNPDDYTTHLVLLGGVDWNLVTRDVIDRVDLPVTQSGRDDDSGSFEVDEDGVHRSFAPVLQQVDGHDVLVEDVAHFYRGPNPYNKKRTVTICNGMFGRGTLGAVRALTDARFRDRNEAYVEECFDGQDTFSILMRVPVANGMAVTPDWTDPEIRMHEWPKGAE